jgi:TonB family protein
MMAFTAALSASTRDDPRDRRTRRPCAELIDVHADTTTLADSPFAKAQLRPLDGKGPRYPVHLRNAREEGDVVATYIIDTLGHVMRSTAEITAESDRAFGESVCTFLASAKFVPIPIGGRKRTVRILDQHFKFRID